MLEKEIGIKGISAKDIMTINPKTINENDLAVSALDIMRKNSITQLVVTNNNIYLGIIHIHDLLQEGLI